MTDRAHNNQLGLGKRTAIVSIENRSTFNAKTLIKCAPLIIGRVRCRRDPQKVHDEDCPSRLFFRLTFRSIAPECSAEIDSMKSKVVKRSTMLH